jgi:hypothetical protein
LRETVVTDEEQSEICPQAPGLDRDKLYREFEQCRKRFDFSQAKVDGVETKGHVIIPEDSNAKCGKQAQYDLITEMKVTVSANGKRYAFRMGPAVKTDDGWRSADELDCSAGEIDY